MKKKELKKEIERLQNQCIKYREDIRVLTSKGREFDKAIITNCYTIEDDIHNLVWNKYDFTTRGGLPNGILEQINHLDINKL